MAVAKHQGTTGRHAGFGGARVVLGRSVGLGVPINANTSSRGAPLAPADVGGLPPTPSSLLCVVVKSKRCEH